MKLLSFTSQGQLNGIAAFFGGIGAQEALKGLSGKFTPLRQWVRLTLAVSFWPLIV